MLCRYDVTTDVWTTINGVLPFAITSFNYNPIFPHLGKAYIFNGREESGDYTSKLIEFDIAAGTWTQVRQVVTGHSKSEECAYVLYRWVKKLKDNIE